MRVIKLTIGKHYNTFMYIVISNNNTHIDKDDNPVNGDEMTRSDKAC